MCRVSGLSENTSAGMKSNPVVTASSPWQLASLIGDNTLWTPHRERVARRWHWLGWVISSQWLWVFVLGCRWWGTALIGGDSPSLSFSDQINKCVQLSDLWDDIFSINKIFTSATLTFRLQSLEGNSNLLGADVMNPGEVTQITCCDFINTSSRCHHSLDYYEAHTPLVEPSASL